MAGARRAAGLAAAALLLALAAPAPALAARASAAERIAAQHVKVLAYDRLLHQRTRGELVIAVLYEPRLRASEREGRSMLAAFRDQVDGGRVRTIPASVVSVPYRVGQLADSLRQVGAGAVYVAGGLDDAIDEVVEAGRALRLATLTSRRGDVERGVAIGVILDSGRVSLVINLEESRRSRVDLDAKVLRLAEVVGSSEAAVAGTSEGAEAVPADYPAAARDDDAAAAVELPQLLELVRPRYTPAARRRGVEGTVSVAARVGVDGSVVETRLRTGVAGAPGLVEAALSAVRRARFRPGRRGGRPSEMWSIVEVAFSLDR